MSKFDFHDVSIFVPVQVENDERMENFDAVLRYFDTFVKDAEIIVIESGPVQRCQHVQARDDIVYEFVLNDGPFQKPYLLNRGLRLTTRDLVAMHDADTLFKPEAIDTLVRIFRQYPEVVFGLPHNGVCLDIGGDDKARYLESFDSAIIPYVEQGELHRDYGNSIVCTSPVAVGGANYYRKEVLLALGGFNENFSSYGWDDFELETRFTMMGYPPCVIKDSNVFHLHHERGIDSQQNTALANRNKALFHRIADMSREELERYIEAELAPQWRVA